MGDGRLSLSTSGLQSAAGDYGTACSKYNQMLAVLDKAVKTVGQNWGDNVGAQWNAMVPKLMESFGTISTNLTSNAAFLGSIAQTSGDTQKKAQAAVQGIF